MTTQTKNSGEIRSEIEKLVRVYEETVRAELKDMAQEDRQVGWLANFAKGQSSNWSGGFSVTNMLEQICRTVALDLLDRLQFKLEHAKPVSILD